MAQPIDRADRARRRRRGLAAGAAVLALSSVLTACSESSAKPVLTWYINPDPTPPADFEGAFGQAGIAERCSTDEYDIETQLLPTSATEQRIQLLRRLAAGDESIDLMSMDPVFTAEFAAADYLLDIPDEVESAVSEGTLQGAIDGATWEDELVVAPLWANTQVLWFRKSLAEAAGLDMEQPVTWDQIIDAAADQGGSVGVQANRYEGYVVWINALVQGAGGNIMENTEEGADAQVTLASDAGREAATVIQKLADSEAAQADLSVSNEGTVLTPFGEDPGGFQVNWTFVYNNYAADEELLKDIGWTRYPATVEGEESKPPIGGINIGIGASTDEPELAAKAVECITSEEEQVQYAVETANMPAKEGAYEAAELREQFPADLLDLFRESIDTAGPRPASPYWATVVNGMLGDWHPASSVDPQRTPDESAEFVEAALKGEALL